MCKSSQIESAVKVPNGRNTQHKKDSKKIARRFCPRSAADKPHNTYEACLSYILAK